MTDRKLMQQALEGLEKWRWGDDPRSADDYITALRERLAQPDPDFYGYASRLAVAIWEQHYKDVAPQWKPLDDLIGVLTQIDNMTAGLTRLAQPEQEPVAWGCNRYIEDDNGFQIGTDEPELVCGKYAPDDNGWWPLYTAPPQRKPLTDEEISNIWCKVSNTDFVTADTHEFARAIEAAHGIGEKPDVA